MRIYYSSGKVNTLRRGKAFTERMICSEGWLVARCYQMCHSIMLQFYYKLLCTIQIFFLIHRLDLCRRMVHNQNLE